MTFKELLGKGEGKAYIVKKINPVSISEIDCITITYDVARERNYFYFDWYYNHPPQYILARKSKNKRRARRDGNPSVVHINGQVSFFDFNHNDVKQSRIEKDGYIVFLSKEDACDYVIDKIKQRKLELNKYILKVNKLKFDIA